MESRRIKNAIRPEPHHSVVSCEYISVALNAPQTGETGRSASHVTWSKPVNQAALKTIRRRGHGPDTRHAENGRTLLTKRLADRNRARQSQYPAFRTLTNSGEGTSVNHHRGRRSFAENEINWPKVIQDIKVKNEISFKAIGRMVGMSKDAIRKVAIGKTPEPHYSVGAKLLEIHKRTS